MPDKPKPYEAALIEPRSVQERVLDAAGNLANLLPVVGGSISSFLAAESNERRWRRLEDFLLGLYDDVAKAKAKIHDIEGSEEFDALLEETLRKVAEEPRAERRNLYRSFLKRILEVSVHPDERRILRLIDELGSDHIRVLRAMALPPSETNLSVSSVNRTLIDRTSGDLDGKRIAEIVEDLNSMRLTEMTRFGTTMSGSGAQDLRGDIAPFGHVFLRYIQ